MGEARVLLAAANVVVKMSKLGMDARICHRCGRVYIPENGETLCRSCNDNARLL